MIEAVLLAVALVAVAVSNWRIQVRLAERLYRRQVAMDRQHKALRREVERTRKQALEMKGRADEALALTDELRVSAQTAHRKVDRALEDPRLARVLRRNDGG